MRNHEVLTPAKLHLTNVEPLLEDYAQVYVQQMQGRFNENITFDVIDNSGINLNPFNNQWCECLVEITDAKFSPPPPLDSEEEPDLRLIEFKYLGYRNSCHFFPIPETAKVNGKTDRQRYRQMMDEVFADYGESGFGLKPFDNQPILKASNGYSFLINKFLYKDLLKKTRKGMWIMAKINEVELLSITTPIQREQAPVSTDRVAEQQQQAEAMKVPRRKRFGVF